MTTVDPAAEPKPLKTRSGFMVWKLAVAEMTMLSLLAGYTSLATAMAKLKWAELDPTDKFFIIGGSAAVIVLNVTSFLNKTIAKTEEAEKQKEKAQP